MPKAEFAHIVELHGFHYEVTGLMKPMGTFEDVEVQDIVEYVDPYGLGLGIKRLDIPQNLKDQVSKVFSSEVQELFRERDELAK